MMQLRQVALAARDLAPIRAEIFDLLGVPDDFADPGVGEFGLENSVMAIGNTFLEVVAPTKPGTAAGRWLDRHGGDGGYMALFQVDAIAPIRERIDALGIRKVWDIQRDEVEAFHLHPRDIGAAIVSVDQMNPPEEWVWAGPGWRERRASRVNRITAIDVAAADPEAMAHNWSRVLGERIERQDSGWRLVLDEGDVYFVPASMGHADDFICAIEFETGDPALAQTSADICGTRFRFVGSE